jgi:hypothetical protein
VHGALGLAWENQSEHAPGSLEISHELICDRTFVFAVGNLHQAMAVTLTVF